MKKKPGKKKSPNERKIRFNLWEKKENFFGPKYYKAESRTESKFKYFFRIIIFDNLDFLLRNST